jgi:hypothetical protein
MATPREQLFAKRRRTQPITVDDPEGGAPIQLEARPLSFADRQRIIKDCTTDGELQSDAFALAIVIACIHAPGEDDPMFSLGDRDEIAKMDAATVDQMWQAAAELNGLGADAVKVAEKN